MGGGVGDEGGKLFQKLLCMWDHPFRHPPWPHEQQFILALLSAAGMFCGSGLRWTWLLLGRVKEKHQSKLMGMTPSLITCFFLCPTATEPACHSTLFIVYNSRRFLTFPPHQKLKSKPQQWCSYLLRRNSRVTKTYFWDFFLMTRLIVFPMEVCVPRLYS